jgi:hypothetical protein
VREPRQVSGASDRSVAPFLEIRSRERSTWTPGPVADPGTADGLGAGTLDPVDGPGLDLRLDWEAG